ncbi:MAG: 2-amino-4-hydroxy-6-hydroxymethyldihydropteridine diphosphokinase [Muribaculaceae bacterium]|nr:2-amino-4-hydroxy-6-hydroxymethyldihydropteridine diphosphokinase [Muribaculaceae bacterium]
MSIVHLNLGSNLGDSRAIIGRAIAMIARALAPARLTLSDYITSPPWGFESPHPFTNRGVMITTIRRLDPMNVLRATQEVEQALGAATPHRHADGSYRDRLIDIDIIDIDRMRIDTPRLILPHPHMHERPFVLIPMQQLEPDHPFIP